MFLPSHLYTGSGSDQKVPAPTGSGSATLIRATRATTGALNLRPKHGRLEIRKHFFTVRATSCWNNIPSEMKQTHTGSANGFKIAYAKHREMNNNV